MPQDTSVCVYQAGSLEGQAPTPVDPDNASLHIAEHCLHCTRVVERHDGMPVYMDDTLLGYLHVDCADAWRDNLFEFAAVRRRPVTP